jgi:hypothetical protein
MRKPTAASVRQAVLEILEGENAFNKAHAMSESIEEQPEPIQRTIKRAANLASKARRLRRQQLVETIRSFAGPGPVAIMVDGTILTITDEWDKMAVVGPSRIITL